MPLASVAATANTAHSLSWIVVPSTNSQGPPSSPLFRTVQSHFPRLGSIPDVAWRTYWQLCGSQHHLFSKTTFANIVHDFMVDAAKEVCSGSEKLDYREQYRGMHVVIVEREAVVRFKKFDQDLRISNVETEAQKKIDRGEISLFGDRIEGVVTVGYMPDEFRLNNQGIYAVKHGRGGDPTWSVRIEEDAIVRHQIDDMFGVRSDESTADRQPEESKSIKIRPNVNRSDEPNKQERES